MTAREIIFDIKEKLKINSDDMDITDEYIYHLINVKRSILIRQRYKEKIKSVPTSIKTELCIPLELADSIEGVSCFGTILRSVNKLPKLVEIEGREALMNIRRLDRKHTFFNLISIERLPYVGHNSFIDQSVYVVLDTDYRIYFVSNQLNHKLLETVRVTIIPEDPEEADMLKCDQSEVNTDCEVFDKEYPVETYMVNDIVNMIVNELSRTLNIPEDKDNDADGERD